MVTTVKRKLMGYPWAGFYCFEQLEKGIYNEYKMYFVNEYIINGFSFHIHDN